MYLDGWDGACNTHSLGGFVVGEAVVMDEFLCEVAQLSTPGLVVLRVSRCTFSMASASFMRSRPAKPCMLLPLVRW